MLPMIRRVTPGLIAQQITAVQPMTSLSKEPYTTGVDYSSDNPFEVEWYWVQTSSPFIYSIKYSKVPPLINKGKWCEETFGKSTDTTWKTYLSKYYFKEEDMRTMFILRWSNDL